MDTVALGFRRSAWTDTVDRANHQRRRGRHAAARHQHHESVDALTVGAVCLIAGHPLPAVTPEGSWGRHSGLTARDFALAG